MLCKVMDPGRLDDFWYQAVGRELRMLEKGMIDLSKRNLSEAMCRAAWAACFWKGSNFAERYSGTFGSLHDVFFKGRLPKHV